MRFEAHLISHGAVTRRPIWRELGLCSHGNRAILPLVHELRVAA
jgi:hypothetical protein